MNKLIAALVAVLLVSCGPATKQIAVSNKGGTVSPEFVLDYSASCTNGGAPLINANSIVFGNGIQCQAGRVVSTQSYANIVQIKATLDLSKLTSNYVNATFYLVQNPNNPSQQPIGSDYCDAGGKYNSLNCRELDTIETNGNKLFQTTLHLGNGGSTAPQRYEYAYSQTAMNNSCFTPANMFNEPSIGLHDATAIDISKPFDIIETISYDEPRVIVKYQQGPVSVIVYDTDDGMGAEGSSQVDLEDLVETMSKGYWLEVSFWQGYSPTGPGSSPWWNGSCNWGPLCNNTGSYWSISNIQITTK